MAKRIICFIIVACLLCGTVPHTVLASKNYQEGYVDVFIQNNGTRTYYPARRYGETVYMSVYDIGDICGYGIVVDDYIDFIRPSLTDFVTNVNVFPDGIVEGQGKEWKIDVVHENETYYLPLAEMLYLLHAQWCVEDGILIVQQLPNNIADFLGKMVPVLWENRVKPTDLLINGESELAHTLRCSLAVMFNDFDIFDHIDWDMIAPDHEVDYKVDDDGNLHISVEEEPDGSSPFVGEQYEKALLQLSVDDEAFLKPEDQVQIAKLVAESEYKQIKSSWDVMNNSMKLPSEIPKTAEQMNQILDQIGDSVKEKPSRFFDAFGDLSGLKDVPWKNYTDFLSKYKITEITDFLGKCAEVNEIYQRSQNWGDAFIGQMEVLTDFDNAGYNTDITDYIKEQSRKIVAQYNNNEQVILSASIDKMFDFAAGIALDATPLGVFLSLPNLGIAGVRLLNENVKTAMDSASLAYMVDCLIKTEYVALVEMSRGYEELLALSIGSEFDNQDLERLRSAIMLALRCNLRNRTFVYYLNTLSNDDPDWEQTEEAKNIRRQIRADYVAICDLMKTEGSDRVMLRMDLDHLFNMDDHGVGQFSTYGDVRQKFGTEIFCEGKIPEYDIGTLVTDAYANDCTYTVNKYNYETQKSENAPITSKYRIPQINLTGSQIAQINEDIFNTLYPVAQEATKEIAEYNYPFTSQEISYKWAINGDILSLVVLNCSMPDYGGIDEYMVYNISISNETQISDVCVVESAGFMEPEFRERAKQVLGARFWSNWNKTDSAFESASFVEFFNKQLGKTISDNNISQALPYLNSDGQLCIVAKLYSLAAADYYWHDLNMVDFEYLPYYADQATVISHQVDAQEKEDSPKTTEPEETIAVSKADSISENELLGDWVVDAQYTMDYNSVSMWDIYGTSFSDSSNKMTFSSDGSFQYYVGWCYGNGTYELANGEINVTITDGDPIQGPVKLIIMTDGITRIALDQYGDGNLVFWIKA